MNDRQLKLFVRAAFSMTNAENAALKQANPVLFQAMLRIRELVETLPEESLLQAQAWRRLTPEVMQALRPYNDALRNSLIEKMVQLEPEIRENVIKSLEAVKGPLPPVTRGPVLGAPLGGLDSIGAVQLTDNVVDALSKTSVAGVKLDRLFRIGDQETPVSLWMQQNYRAIDNVVRTGIIQGASTEAIANSIRKEVTMNGLLRAPKNSATSKVLNQSKTIARTSIQSFNRQVTEQVWRDNADALEGLLYEWTSALDARVCPTCAPLDGQKKAKRSDLPDTPVHPNCRCNVVLVDPSDDDDVRTGIVVSTKEMRGKGAYKSKVQVKGQDFFRKAVTLEKKGATYSDYLAQLAEKDSLQNRTTLSEFFGGGGKAGQGESTLGTQRAEWFRTALKRGVPADEALIQLTNKPDAVTKLRSFKTELPVLPK